MKIACGLVRPSAGEAHVAGEPAGSPAARAAIGYLAELFRFPDWLRADELLELHQRLAGSDGGEARAARAARAGRPAATRPARASGAMSKGMQQRLGIAQALVGAPRLLMLDEPTSALDPVGRRIVRDLLLELKRRGVAVLLNSHLLSEVERVCDRVAILVDGRIVARGSPAELARARGVEVELDGRRARVPRGRPRAGAGDRRRAGRGRRAGLRRARALLDARGHLPRGAWRRPRERRRWRSPAYALRESTRRRVFVVVLILTVAFLALYAVGTEAAFDSIDAEAAGEVLDVDDQVLTGSTLLGLAMFTTLFLGCVLAVFLTLGAVRGDAERGLLQPLVVRPLGRTALLAGRFAAAAGVCGVYVAGRLRRRDGHHRRRGRLVAGRPGRARAGLVAGVILIAALSLLGSIFLSATANGIAIFMAFGAGLAAGLLGQIGDALDVDTLKNVAEVTSWLLPFEALYQGGLELADRGRRRQHRADRPARPVRRRAGGRAAAVGVERGVPGADRGGRAGGVCAPRPVRSGTQRVDRPHLGD